jgi:uncharacterized protein YndB with AHSA1/START domain
MTDTYHFVSRWRVKATPEEVFDIISQPTEFPRWWPAVYLDARQITAGAPDGTGRRVHFHTRGWLPYTLHWEATTTETERPRRIAIEATGDFNGSGVWSFQQDGEFTDITYEWNVIPSRPVLRTLTPALRPVFEANHRWAMQLGEGSLREELIRYRANTPGELLDAAEPRGPVELPVRWIAAGALAISALTCIALLRRKSRRTQVSPAV